MRIEDLSVNERVLIHLRDMSTDPVNDGAKLGQTQEGIAEGIGIRINHVPRATNSLLGDGYIGEALVHIGGLKRKRKAFFLTGKGIEAADGLISDLKGQKVLYRDSEGKESMLSIQDMLFKARTTKPSSLILSSFKDGVVLEDTLTGASAATFISMLDMISPPEIFVNRVAEMSDLEKWLDAGQRVITISGIKGIGKTSLAWKTLKGYESRKNILWYTAHEWDTSRAFLDQVSEMYVRLGRNEVKKILRQSRDVDITQAASALIRDMQDSDSVLVIDNVFDLKREVMQLLNAVCEQTRNLHNSCLVLITRDMELMNCIPSAIGCRNITVQGLERESAMKLMGTMGLEPEDSDRVYAMTQGHPLAIKLVNSDEIKKVIDTKGLTKEEVWVVRCMKAFNAIFDE